MIGRGALAMAALAAVLIGAASLAATRVPDAVLAEQRRLVLAKQQSADAQARAARLDQAAAAEQDAAAKVRAQEAAVNARIDQAEADIAAAQARIALVQARIDAQRAGLATQQGPIVRLLAALESLARRPAIAAVAQPGSVDDLVHVRAVLGAVTPTIDARTAAIRSELAQTRALRASAALAVKSLADGRAALDTQQLQLARLEATHQQRSLAFGREALAQSDRAIAMGEAARDALDRVGELDAAADTGERLAALPDPAPRPLAPGAAPSLIGTVGWGAADAPYRLPVSGTVVTGLGEVSSAGISARGLTLAPAPGAAVIAPAGGRVAYAGPFRDFGAIVILDHGDGWTTLITGLAALDVRRGDRVRQGAPIGRAGGDAPRITVELRRRGRPIDMIPLLG